MWYPQGIEAALDAGEHKVAHHLAVDASAGPPDDDLAPGFAVKIEAHQVAATRHRPQGVKFCLTLHDPAGRRVYGIDNAHGIRSQPEYDHRHIYGARKVRGYVYRGAAELLEDFYKEVERILRERRVR